MKKEIQNINIKLLPSITIQKKNIMIVYLMSILNRMTSN